MDDDTPPKGAVSLPWRTLGRVSLGNATLRGDKIRMYKHSVLVITNVFYVNILIDIYYCQVYFAEIMKFDVKYICYDSN